MKRSFTLVFLCLISIHITNAQVGIGTTTPDASSILDIESSNLGVLFPRVSISSLSDTTTIPSPKEGLVIYNPSSNSCQLPAGLYIFDGSQWQKISYSTTSKESQRLIRDEIGVANVTFTAYSSNNIHGDYASLFDNIDNIGSSSFHSIRSGSPSGDWGFGISLPQSYFINQLTLDGRNDCCTNRVVNVIIRLYNCGNLIYSSAAITTSNTGNNIVNIPNIYADEIRLVVPNGGTTQGGIAINFSELSVVGRN